MCAQKGALADSLRTEISMCGVQLETLSIPSSEMKRSALSSSVMGPIMPAKRPCFTSVRRTPVAAWTSKKRQRSSETTPSPSPSPPPPPPPPPPLLEKPFYSKLEVHNLLEEMERRYIEALCYVQSTRGDENHTYTYIS